MGKKEVTASRPSRGNGPARMIARLAGADAVFLPFCDTDEENLVSDCKGRRLSDPLSRVRMEADYNKHSIRQANR